MNLYDILISLSENDKRMIFAILIIVILLLVLIGYLGFLLTRLMKWQGKTMDTLIHDPVVTKVIKDKKHLIKFGRKKNWALFYKQAWVPFIIILVAFAATAVGLMRDPANFASLNIFNLIIFIAIQVFLHTAFGTGFMAIYEMARGLVAPLVLSFVFAGGTHLLILNSITAKIAEAVPALGNIFESIIAPTEFSVVTLSKYMKLGEIGTPYIKVMLLGAVLLVVYTILGSTIFRKRDTF